MKYKATHKTFNTSEGIVHFSFNMIESGNNITAYFTPAEDDFNAFKLTRGRIIYFEFLHEARNWITVSPFEIDDELLNMLKAQLPEIKEKKKKKGGSLNK